MTPPLLQATSVVLGEGQVNSYQARLSTPALYLPPRHTVTGPNTKEREDRRLPGTRRKLESSEQKHSRMPSSGMTQIFKASLVSSGCLNQSPGSASETLKAKQHPGCGCGSPPCIPSQGKYSRGGMLRSTPTCFHRNHICLFFHYPLFFSQSGSTFSSR